METILSNKRIFEFYRDHPGLSLEKMNLLLIDFIENIDLSRTLETNIHKEILQAVKDIQQQVVAFPKELGSNYNSMVIKFHEMNREFLETMKWVMESTINANTDKLSVNLEKTTDIFLAKMVNLLPKNTEIAAEVELSMRKMQEGWLVDMKALQDPAKWDEYIKTVEEKVKLAQQPILSFLAANQDNLMNQLTGIKETSGGQEKLFQGLSEFLGKYKSSSSLKGQYSENLMEQVLNKMYPMAQVLNTTGNKANGDFMLRRSGLETILIENKNYESNVNVDEIKKFLRDIKEQNCHGIFLSQISGIVNKSNFAIEVHDGNVMVYVHNVEYSPEKIKTAIDIIDHLAAKLRLTTDKEGCTIEKETLDNINAEFQVFLNQKEMLVTSVRDFQKKMLTQIEDIKMPELQVFLNGKYAPIQNNEFTCDVCGESFAKRNSLASHKKVHKIK